MRTYIRRTDPGQQRYVSIRSSGSDVIRLEREEKFVSFSSVLSELAGYEKDNDWC